MQNPLLNPIVLRGLYCAAMGRAVLRYRNRRRRQIDRYRRAFYEQAWRDAAAELGASYKALAPGFGEIELEGVIARVAPNCCELDNPVTSDILVDKLLTYRLLESEGLATTRHAAFSFSNIAPALQFLRNTDRECVVKPAAGTGGGRGVTTSIRTPWQLARAAAAASVYTNDLLIEEQVQGDNYRLLYLDGRLIDSFVRRSPGVIADGRSSVAQLVAQANSQRLSAGIAISQVLLTIDLDMRRTLAKQGLTLRSIPSEGMRVTLKTVVNENAGVDNSTATHLLCPEIVEDGAKAARALRVRLAGVDIITPDPSRPLAEAGGVMLEVNSPNFYYHYHKQDGCFPVAVHVLRSLLKVDERETPALPWRPRRIPAGVAS